MADHPKQSSDESPNPPAEQAQGDRTVMFNETQIFDSGDPVSPKNQSSSMFDIESKFGKYEIKGVLGKGGMGIVYAARDTNLDRDVALKVLPPEFADDESAIERFLAEARSAAKLSHPHTVAVYDVGIENDTLYIAMELVSGGCVGDDVDAGKRYRPKEATQIIIEAAKGLAAAHGIGLVHRDIKPANLMQTKDGIIKVADFGLAKGIARGIEKLTQTNMVVGTPYFMSPEQCMSSDVDARSDIYSLGATYYTLLTGKSPFHDSGSAMQIMFAHCHKDLPDPRETNPNLPEGIVQVLHKSMAKVPEERYQTMQEMIEDLQLVILALSGFNTPMPMKTDPVLLASNKREKVSSSSDLPPVITTNWRRYLPWGIGFVGVVAVVILATLLFPWNGTPPVAEGVPIRVGILHSTSGTMASSESAVVEAVRFAIDEINDAGGVLGRKIEPVYADGQSNPDVFVTEAKRLIDDEKVCTVFGCWTSASRRAVVPIFEERNHLLVYSVQYEGLEMSPNVIYLGAAPNQQILPALNWLDEKLKAKKYFLVGSDYVFPRSAHAIIKDVFKEIGDEVVGEAYIPLGETDVRSVIEQIKKAEPDVILNTINGDSNVAFFRDLRRAGITPEKIPTLSFSIGEQEIRSLDVKHMAGDYAAWTYFQSVDTPENKAFVQKIRDKYGPQKAVTDPMESAYVGVHLWAKAVNEVKNLDPQAIRRSMLTQTMNGPEGTVRIDPGNQHAFNTPRLGQIQVDGQFKIIWESPKAVPPEPYPRSRTTQEWREFLLDMYRGWGDRWEAKQN